MAETPERKLARAVARLGLSLDYRRTDSGAYTLSLHVGKFARSVEAQGETPALALIAMQNRLRDIRKDGSLLHYVNPRSLANLAARNRALRERTTCTRGHAYGRKSPGDKQRRCLVCQSAAEARYRQKRYERDLLASARQPVSVP